MLIHVIKSTGELYLAPGLSYYGQPRPADYVSGRSAFPVQVRFLADDTVTPVLIDAGSTLYFDCKGQGLYDSANFAVTVAIHSAPTDPATGYYEGQASTNTPGANALLSPNDSGGATPEAEEPDSVPLMAQLCWQAPGVPAPEPARSRKWPIILDNSVRHGTEGVPTSGTPAYPSAPALIETMVESAATAAQVQYAYRDYAAEATNAIDALLVGRTPSFANLQGNGTQNFFSTYAPTATPPVFTRNPACIIPWPSFVSLWNSANADGTGGNRGRVTMVTPTQGLTNNHFAQPYQPGVQHIFLGTDGQPYTLTVASSAQVGTSDCRIVTFTGPAPAAVGAASVFAPGMVSNLFAAGTPLLSLDQEMQAVIAELVSSPPAGGTTEVAVRSATAANRVAWAAPVIVGDSDSPVFVMLGATPVLLTTYHSSMGGPPIAELAPSVNALLSAGTPLNVAPVNVLGAASKRDVAGGPGPVVALSANGQIDPSLYTAGSSDGGTPGVEQIWDGSANITMDAATTLFRVMAASLTGIRVIKLPAIGATEIRSIKVIIPAGITGLGTLYVSPTSGPTLTSGLPAASTDTRVLVFTACGGAWRYDNGIVRQGDALRPGEVILTPGSYLHWANRGVYSASDDSNYSFRWGNFATDGDGKIIQLALGAGQSLRRSADGTQLEVFTPGDFSDLGSLPGTVTEGRLIHVGSHAYMGLGGVWKQLDN